jgi:hypothetical protein
MKSARGGGVTASTSGIAIVARQKELGTSGFWGDQAMGGSTVAQVAVSTGLCGAEGAERSGVNGLGGRIT